MVIKKLKKILIKRKPILIVPGLSCNLLSVRRLEANRFKIRIKDERGVIERNGKRVVIGTRGEVSQLYTIHLEKEGSCCSSLSEESLTLWRKRLGTSEFRQCQEDQRTR